MRTHIFACAAAMLAACARAQSGSPPASGSTAASARVVEVVEILDGNTKVNEAVSVRGTCIRMDEKVAFGPAPSSRSDWQMRDTMQSQRAVWVVGARPSDCGYDKGSAEPVTIRAIVARDTVQQVGGAGVPRWYLQRVAEE